jgi:hypothetical protein
METWNSETIGKFKESLQKVTKMLTIIQKSNRIRLWRKINWQLDPFFA